MKKTGKCPKCGAEDVLRIPGKAYGGQPNYVLAGLTRWSAKFVSRYICCACGYTEEWIESREDIQSLKDEFG